MLRPLRGRRIGLEFKLGCVGIMALGAFEIAGFKNRRRHPFAPSDTMGTGAPVLVNQPMAPGAQVLYVEMRDARAVVGGEFVTVLDKVAVVASVICAMIQLYHTMGKQGLNNIRIRDAGPIGMA